MKKDECLEQLLSAITYRAELFFNDEMKIKTMCEGQFHSVNKIELKKYTTVIGIGGTLNCLFYTTYDQFLLDKLMQKFIFGEIDTEEFLALRESAAGEIANTIIGHSITDFPNRGYGVTLTPPSTIEDAKSILNTEGTGMINTSLLTPFGNIEFTILGPFKGENCA